MDNGYMRGISSDTFGIVIRLLLHSTTITARMDVAL